jgi:hypothetical protein
VHTVNTNKHFTVAYQFKQAPSDYKMKDGVSALRVQAKDASTTL